MMRCKDCGAPYHPGTLFCRECGRFLGAAGALPAAPIPETGRDAPHIQIRIPHSGREFVRPLTQTLWIGRADPASNFQPDLDLTPDGGLERGVSRQHATIELATTGPIVVDRHSANGTWLDGERLQAQRPYPLPPTAELQLGQLRLHVSLA